MKSVFLALLYSGVAEGIVYRFALTGYSDAIDLVLMLVAIAGAVALGIFATRPFMAFCGATALAAPAISYSMLGYGPLEMGGLLHAFAFGGLGGAAYKLTHGFRLLPPPDDVASQSGGAE
jgi:hypothetical protein